MLRKTLLAALVAVSFVTAAHAADTIVENGTPADGWHYGTGNNYTPANTEVLTTDAGDELDLRFHRTFDVAPAAANNMYNFALGTTPISFDWGIDPASSLTSITSAFMTVARIGGSSFTYDLFFPGNDNSVASGSAQNSARLNWFLPDFDSSVDSTYSATMTVNGLDGGTRSFTTYANVGAGVPEPATWAMMLVGFAVLGFLMRHKPMAGVEPRLRYA